jgi:hypothetical protein
MNRRLVFAITAALTLSGCSLGSECCIQPKTSTQTGWDGLGAVPVHNKVKFAKARKKSGTMASRGASTKESELAALKPYSEEWWSVRDAIDRAAEVELAKKLIICRDCMRSKPDDLTGSIAPK